MLSKKDLEQISNERTAQPPNHHQDQLKKLVERLSEAEEALQALVANQADAIVQPGKLTPLLLRQAQEALLESEARYARLLESLTAVVFEMDADGTLRYVNEAVSKVTGYSPEQLLGQNWLQIFFPGDFRQRVEELFERFRSGDVRDYEITLKTRKGNPLTLELNSANRYRPDGSLATILCIGVDISRHKKTQEELLVSLENLRASSEELRVSEEELRVQNEALVLAQQETQEQRQRYQDLFDFAPDGYLVTDANATIQEANRAATDLLQVRENYLVGKPLAVFIAMEDRQAFHRLIHSIRSEGKPRGWETTILTRAGDSIPVNLIVAPVNVAASDQEPSRVVAMRWQVHNISQRKQVEAHLAYQANLLENVNDAVIAMDERLSLTSWNRAAETIYGWKVEEVIGKPLDEVIKTSMTPEQTEQFLRTLDETGQYHAEVTHFRKDGQALSVDVKTTIVRDETGRLSGYVSVNRDITRRKQDQIALRERDRLIQTAVSGVPVGLFVIDLDGTLRLVLGRSTAALHHRLENLTGHSIFEIYREVPKVIENFRRALEGESFNTIVEIFGTVYEARYAPLVDEQGQIVAVVGASMDITERRRAEEALLKSEARFHTIFDASGLGIDVVGLDGRILEANAALQEMLGYSAEELQQMSFTDLTHPDDIAQSQALFESMVSGSLPRYRYEKRYFHKNGQIVWVQLTVSLVQDAQGDPQFAIGMLENITERKEMEAELSEVQRRLIDSTETERLHLAQELHDGPVQDLYGLTYQLAGLNNSILDEQNEARLASITATLQQVIQTLRNTARELRPPALAPYGLEKAIRSHADQFGRVHHELKLHLDLASDAQSLPERVRLALFRIYQQSLANIVRHAQANNVYVSLLLSEQQITLEVRDDGRGFQVPERWISLVRNGHLGLAGCAERAEAIGGELQVESQPGQGSRVQVHVPIKT